jgi:hypothetical protein
MKQTVSRYDFRRAFETTRPNNFSYAALDALFDYFEQYEEECNVEVELDVIAICCDYSESKFTELIEQYDIPVDSNYGKSEESQIVDWLTDHTIVIDVLDDSIVYLNF